MLKSLDNLRADNQLSILAADTASDHVRWQPGERLHQLFERRCDALGNRPAVITDDGSVSFADLDRLANRLAHALLESGLEQGGTVGLILDRAPEAYAIQLAVMKCGGVFVPLDERFPEERIRYIAEDAGLDMLVASSPDAAALEGLAADGSNPCPVIALDTLAQRAEDLPSDRPDAGVSETSDARCYIIYTSGSTGRPKGVAINHSSICNFVTVAAEIYGYSPDDRVYQGITFAFDFSVEELWVPLLAGAALVPAPNNGQLVGRELAAFLIERNVTALCCVPTLLATIDQEIPELRFLLVSGEACPQDIVSRWARPGRMMLNAYGPTEATVTATITELKPDKPVTIGKPLPTYSAVILDSGSETVVPKGETGELAIAGIGLAHGYVNRPDLTAEKFVSDPLLLPNNPSGRLYRTGDLARINGDDEIEYLGRIDEQVKIRGYRVELSEIESVLLEQPGIAQAAVVVRDFGRESGEAGARRDLVAYIAGFEGADAPDLSEIARGLKTRLPSYMVPRFVEVLDRLPMLPSDKVDRQSLPAPTGIRLTSPGTANVAPRTETERVIAETLADTLGLEAVSVNDDFFDDLAMDSLLIATFLMQLDDALPDVMASAADAYEARTVAELAARLQDSRIIHIPNRTEAAHHVATDWEHLLCGTLQGATYVALALLTLSLFAYGWVWVADAATFGTVTARSVAFVSGVFILAVALPIAAKWTLIGRWTAGRIPIWSLAFYRFWLVRRLINLSPLSHFKGSPLLNLQLRMLGAKVGSDVVILSSLPPLATDLVSIGSGTVLRKNSFVAGYKADRGSIEFGSVRIGRDVIVGDGALLDINTSMGDGAQLGHASSLMAGQSIPEAQRWHGTPARETDTDFSYASAGATSLARRILFSLTQITTAVGVPAALLAVCCWASKPHLVGGNEVASTTGASVLHGFGGALLQAMGLACAGTILFLATIFATNIVLPRILNTMLKPDRWYPLYGFHHFVSQVIHRLSNSVIAQTLSGDSSFGPCYYRWLGWRQPDVRQTGSNFGTHTEQDMPQLCEVGPGTMISDGLVVLNKEHSNTHFRMVENHIPSDSFFGNIVTLPAEARTGANCLYASRVMVPVDGPVRENVGLLGSPPIEIPRETMGSDTFDPVPKTPEQKAKLRAKDRHNLLSALYAIAAIWGLTTLLAVAGQIAIAATAVFGPFSFALTFVGAMPLVLAYFILIEHWSLGFKPLEPTQCTIHDHYFWRVERYWKFIMSPLKMGFRGTPFRPLALRLLGAKVGAKVYDDGSAISEKSLTSIGDNCCICGLVSLQAHSLEDGLFKCDRITIGDNCTLGRAAYIHYGVELGDGTSVEPHTFVMKGVTTEPDSLWQGNPAHRVK